MNVDLKTVSFEEGTEEKQSLFCTAWPAAKVALELMQVILKNAIVRLIVGVIINAGDRMHENICGK